MLKKSLPEISYLFMAIVMILLSLTTSATIKMSVFFSKVEVNESLFFALSSILFFYYAGRAWELNKKKRTLNLRYFQIHALGSILTFTLVLILGYVLTRTTPDAIASLSVKKVYVLSTAQPLASIFYICLILSILVQALFFLNVRKSKKEYRSKRVRRSSSSPSRT